MSFGKDRPDAFIISDPGVFTIAKEEAPDIDIHISTQANNTNYATYRFWYNLGATRVVSARELSMNEIAELRANIPEDMEIETFVHGAMCIAYSGRCLLSNYFTGRDANLGSVLIPADGNTISLKKPGWGISSDRGERKRNIYIQFQGLMYGRIYTGDDKCRY